MSLDKYILDDQGQPVVEPDLFKWAAWMEFSPRHVAFERLGPVDISTVFLGLDHSFRGGPPVVWETMFFGEGRLNGDQSRCAGSREQAEAMHAMMRQRLLSDWRNFNWRKFTNRKRRRKAFRQLKRRKRILP